MKTMLADVLHTVGQAALTPCLIILILLIIAALWQIGDFAVEWFKVRRTHMLVVTVLINSIHEAAAMQGVEGIQQAMEESHLLYAPKILIGKRILTAVAAGGQKHGFVFLFVRYTHTLKLDHRYPTPFLQS